MVFADAKLCGHYKADEWRPYLPNRIYFYTKVEHSWRLQKWVEVEGSENG